MRKRAIERRRRVRGALRRKPASGRIKSALRRRTDRSALELASGRPSVPPVVPALLTGSSLGALLMCFLDPRRGKGRRAKARDPAAAVARRGLRKGGTQLRPVASRATGTAERVARHEPSRKKEFDDAGLAAKVETGLFGNRSIPKGALNVNVEKGVVIIRGEVEQSDQIDKIERAVRRIKAVREVRNLLHTPGTPAPNKAGALRGPPRPQTDAACVHTQHVPANPTTQPKNSPSCPPCPIPRPLGRCFTAAVPLLAAAVREQVVRGIGGEAVTPTNYDQPAA
jgi:hypothetical protein